MLRSLSHPIPNRSSTSRPLRSPISRHSGRAIVSHRHRREMGVVSMEQQRGDDLLAFFRATILHQEEKGCFQRYWWVAWDNIIYTYIWVNVDFIYIYIYIYIICRVQHVVIMIQPAGENGHSNKKHTDSYFHHWESRAMVGSSYPTYTSCLNNGAHPWWWLYPKMVATTIGIKNQAYCNARTK